MKKVSILMSIYNESEKEILESINSILNQTYQNIELIIVIDNPQKKLTYTKIINNHFNDKKQIKVIYNDQNIGLAMSMNKAFKNSKGFYVARMDADDIAHIERIQKEVYEIETNDYDLICSGYTFIDEENRIISNSYIYYTSDDIKNNLITTNCIHHPTVLMKRDIFQKVGGYRDFPCSQDYDLWLRLLQNGCKFFMIDEPLIKYRIRENSTTNRKRFLQACTLFYINQLFYQRITIGKDVYSKENYHKFINECNIRYKSYKRNIIKIQKIQRKLGQNILKDILIRLVLLIKSNFIRDTYFLKIKIRKKIRTSL